MCYIIWLFVALTVCVFSKPVFAEDRRHDVHKCVALTFDDGPSKILTPRLLNILRDMNVRATFYLLGSLSASYPHIVKEIQHGGHEIGNHSWSHLELTKISPEELRLQIRRTDKILELITGVIPRTFRPPYGAINKRVQEAFQRQCVLWDVDTLDWLHRRSSWIIKTVMKETRPNAIILMHDIHLTTIDAVPSIIRWLRDNRYSFVTVSELKSDYCVVTR